MKRALYLVAFLAGSAVGALAAVKYIKHNYDISEKKDELEPEEEETKEDRVVFREPKDEQQERIDRTNDDILKSIKDPGEKEEAKELLNKYFNKASVYGETGEPNYGKPYQITPDQYGEFEDYSTIELTYYSDGILADDRDEIVENAEELLGKDFSEWFGDEDEIFVRNDDRCTDYNVIRDLETYDALEGDRARFKVEG